MSSTLLALETHRSLVRLSREKTLDAALFQRAMAQLEQDSEVFKLRDLALDICAARVMPVVSTPRSLDLAHLATAIWFHERTPLRRFVSLDDRQNLAARELGLPV